MKISVEVEPRKVQARHIPCIHSSHTCSCSTSPLTEEVLWLVFRSANWNPFMIVSLARVCKWFLQYAKFTLWKEFCISRGPKMVSDIISGGHPVRIQGGWDALGRLMIYCAGCHGTHEVPSKTIPGHFVRTTRFSKTSGRSFLISQCRSDILYISDPCEHTGTNGEDDIGLFRGVIRTFSRSATFKFLAERRVDFEPKELCPFCFSKVWSLLRANMIPKSALRRLGAHGDVEYFVCLNGHLHGRCSLLHLSDSEVSSEED